MRRLARWIPWAYAGCSGILSNSSCSELRAVVQQLSIWALRLSLGRTDSWAVHLGRLRSDCVKMVPGRGCIELSHGYLFQVLDVVFMFGDVLVLLANGSTLLP